MEHPFNVESPNREPLAELATRVVDVDTRIRSLQSQRSTLLAQAHGELTPRHVRSVVDAGRVIEHWATGSAGSTLTDEHGQGLTPEETQVEVARRHAQYAAAVLPYAQALTPAGLVPVAKRLAEKFAGVTFDDRHQHAVRDRRVWITEATTTGRSRRAAAIRII